VSLQSKLHVFFKNKDYNKSRNIPKMYYHFSKPLEIKKTEEIKHVVIFFYPSHCEEYHKKVFDIISVLLKIIPISIIIINSSSFLVTRNHRIENQY